MVNVGAYFTESGEIVTANDREIITPDGHAAVKAMTPTKDWIESLLASVDIDETTAVQANQERKEDNE